METVLQGVYVTLGGTTDPGQNGRSEWIHARRTDRFNCSGHAHDRLYSTHCVHIGLDFHVSCPAIPIGELRPQSLAGRMQRRQSRRTFAHYTGLWTVASQPCLFQIESTNQIKHPVTFCFRERHALQAVVIRDAFFSRSDDIPSGESRMPNADMQVADE